MKLMFYFKLIQNPIIQKVISLLESYDDALYHEILSELLNVSYELEIKGDLFKQYLCYLIAADENAFSLTAEHAGTQMDKSLQELVLKDIEILKELFSKSPFEVCLREKEEPEIFAPIYESFSSANDNVQILEDLAQFYYIYGAGSMNRYPAFKWDKEKGLIGIRKCDPIRLENLIGCEYQKRMLINNTENFLQGKGSNNVLLFGDSGTGKSSSVKGLLNEYYDQGLRLIELTKSDFKYFNKILSQIKRRGLKFILFLDDLSFEEFETEYKYMKALIEGGVEVKPDNVLIYATSNRRHLIRETWEERKGEDIHISDTRQEKLSLSDRFGLTLTFTSPNQNLYLKIVYQLARDNHIELPEETLREKAIQWELVHGGRSGRVAKQFIQTLI